MSTSFNIIPTMIDKHLTFDNVLKIAKQTMNDYLLHISVDLTVDINVNIHDTNEAYVKNWGNKEKFIWAETEYAWFTIEKSVGGIDAYCEKITKQLSQWETYLEDTLENITVTPKLKQQIIDCEYEWHFRRSAGQMPIVNIAHGHLAAALAKLTDGYIYSYDGALSGNIFPATSEQLLGVYFYPDKSENEADQDWITRCTEGILEEFGSR